ncbi:beta-propeller fold lactonase family protein [Bifidobacterium sp. ESL0764]|uniref:lactonase family protein n=1 Tax=Bifidobacterium sp. ESL0764 TaxID=2983228 RepID=UPI0023F81657|nr:beta-propeller fold lactonase family protein [Bifidobacterium sp. ESL0764]WEV66037.1 beta-propeller fold lactonase family protein [Bifidobacterium sp. ESL0764]
MNIQIYRLLVGGFGAIHHEKSKGVERYLLVLPTCADAKAFDVKQVSEMPTDVEEEQHTAKEDISLRSPRIVPAGVASVVPSPSWLLREGDTVFAVLEDTDEVATLRIVNKGTGSPAASDDAFDENAEMTLKEISRVKLPAGSGPTHAAIAVDRQLGHHLITADYADGTVCVLPIGEGDVLGPVAQVLDGDRDHHGPLPAQEGPHAHWILPLPDGRVLTTDLGADRIYIHRWIGSRLVRTGFVSLSPGTGPRDMHILPGPSGELAEGGDWRIAVVDEWGCTVTVLEPNGGDEARRSKDGNEQIEEFRVAQTVSLGGDKGKSPDQAASLAFVPESRHLGGSEESRGGSPFSRGYVYVGLRGSDRIVTLYWDGSRLSRLTEEGDPGWKGRGVSSGGERPRHILAVGNMLVVANEVSDNLSLFRAADDGEPVHLGDYPAGSPTVVLPLTGI